MTIRIVAGLLAVVGLAGVFLFQQTDVAAAAGFQDAPPIHRFIINRTVRFLLNDLFALTLIYALFLERRYVLFAVWVQVAGVFLFLIPYFVIKLNFPNYNGPLINYLHRLILNPTLLLLLIPAFYYQKMSRTESD